MEGLKNLQGYRLWKNAFNPPPFDKLRVTLYGQAEPAEAFDKLRVTLYGQAEPAEAFDKLRMVYRLSGLSYGATLRQAQGDVVLSG